MTMQMILNTKRKYQTALLKLPGVKGVSIGYKTVAGALQDTLAICIHVVDKRNWRGARIPRYLEGIPTDVVESNMYLTLGKQLTGAATGWHNAGYQETMVGGIAISNQTELQEGYAVGTLGLVIQSKTNRRAVMLSAKHIILPAGVDDETKISQPPPTINKSRLVASVGPLSSDSSDDLAGATLKKSVKFTYGRVSVDKSNHIDVKAGSQTGGAKDPSVGESAIKYGAHTGMAKSVVTNIEYSGNGVGNGFLVKTDPSAPFGDEGDSGAIVLNDKNQVLGMLLGFDPNANAAYCVKMSYVNLRLNTEIPATKELSAA